MAQGREFEGTDKAAAILLGTPLVAGLALLAMALFLPGTAPYEDRRTIIPIAIGSSVVGTIGGLAYVRWRRRRKQSVELQEKARLGALRLQPNRQTPLIIEISFALANEFLLPKQACALPVQPRPITVGDIADCVFVEIRDLESKGTMLIDPTGIENAATFVAKYADSASAKLAMVTPLADVVPRKRRRDVA